MTRRQIVNKSYFLNLLNLDFAPIEKIFENTGLTVAYLEQNENIEISSAIKVVENLYKYSHTPMWPSLYGTHVGISGHGPVGYATFSAATLGEALTTLATWQLVRATIYSWEIIEHDNDVEVVLHDTTGNSKFAEFYFEATASSLEGLLSTILGHRARSDVKINFKMQAGAGEKQQALVAMHQSQLCFGQSKNSFVVPKAIWLSPSPLFDEQSHDFNVSRCKHLYEQLNQNADVGALAANIIREHLDKTISATMPLSPLPSQTQIASKLNMSTRTLIRKLKLADSSYKKIVENERSSYAIKLLKTSNFTLLNIAELLGYSELANFSRAFKSWYQMSPSQYRQALDVEAQQNKATHLS